VSTSSDAKTPAPLSVAVLFAPVFLCVTLLHATLLSLPYFWDEGGYYIPAAWDFFRLGTVIPVTTMRNAHPPLPSVLLAGWWKIFGFHILSTRLFMCVVTTFALLAVFRLARMFAGQAAAFAVLILTAIYPVWFAQSTLAHADMFAAAFTLWALCFYADRPGWTIAPQQHTARTNMLVTAVLFSLACLAKETAIVIPAALFCFEIALLAKAYPGTPSGAKALSLRKAFTAGLKPCPSESSPKREPLSSSESSPWKGPHPLENSSGSEHTFNFAMLAALATPAILLALWYAYHHWKTGFTFGNPEYLRYNATANISLKRVLLSLRHRLVHLVIHLNLFFPFIAGVVIFLLPSRTGKPFLPVPALRMITVLLFAQWIAFSILGGALLTRYILPAYPLLLLVCVSAWMSRTKHWPWLAAGTLAAFTIACEVNPPYPYAPEDNLGYRDMIVVQQGAIDYVAQHYPYSTVLTAWPVLANLQRPELGYVQKPIRTVPTENFTREELLKATMHASNPGLSNYDVAILFSTKYDPPAGGLNLAGHSSNDDKRFYDYHRDLLPGEAVQMLGGRIVWQEDRKGEWAAVLVFPRGEDARLASPMIWRIDHDSGKL